MSRRARAGSALAVAGLALLAGASPAAADPPQPTDFRSTVTDVSPAPDGWDVAVVGGDGFLELRVDDGHEAAVPGYEGEPYLRFLPDGTVERNRLSPTTYANEDRYGAADAPAEAVAEAEPDWERVAGGGEYAWHDHRIHWMATVDPPGHEAGDLINRWTVDLTVDGEPAEVAGELVWVEPVSPLPWAVLGIAALAAVVALGRWAARRGAGQAGRTDAGHADGPDGGPADGPDGDEGGRAAPAGEPARRWPVAGAAATVAAVLALVVGAGQLADAPPGTGVSPLLVVVPAVGLALGAAAVVLHRRLGTGLLGLALPLAAVAAVAGWALLRLEVLWKPVLPTVLPAGLDRAGTSLALGLSVGAAVLVVLGVGVLAPRTPVVEVPPGGGGPT